MEAPHNAVLIICECHEKGCRPFMCDTSHRHSNCLDQYRKLPKLNQTSTQEPLRQPAEQLSMPRGPYQLQFRLSGGLGGVAPGFLPFRLTNHLPQVVFGDLARGTDPGAAPAGHGTSTDALQVAADSGAEEPSSSAPEGSEKDKEQAALVRLEGLVGRVTAAEKGLLCPLCRGSVVGWTVVKGARAFCDKQERACSKEGCLFSGKYGALRAHAKKDHPRSRPQEADPARRLEWDRLQRTAEAEDVLSTLRATMPGGRVFGDYLVEDEEEEEMGSDGEGLDADFLLPMFDWGLTHLNPMRPAFAFGMPAPQRRVRGGMLNQFQAAHRGNPGEGRARWGDLGERERTDH